MRINELRQIYLRFFKEREHKTIRSSSLLPEHDATALFTMAGMHPLMPFLLGQPHPQGTRLVNVQKCIRMTDIDEVGDTTHLTFFEMLGNWSLGDYWKKEAITWSFEFLTSPEWLGFNKEKLFVTVFEGDDDAPKDTEAIEIWKSVGIPEKQIYPLPKSENWWGPPGVVGPCGPCSEMFIETDDIPKCSPKCRPGCHCGHFVEVWNDVFMEYNRKDDGSYEKLKRRNIDTGMGVERTAAMLQGVSTVYETEAFVPMINRIKDLARKDELIAEEMRLARIIADHVKAAVMIMADDAQIAPSNVEHGYIARRLIRKAILCADNLGIGKGFLQNLAEIVIDMYEDIYDEVRRNCQFVIDNLRAEDTKFRNTLKKALRRFDRILNETGTITGSDAFLLFTSFGLPLEMTRELAQEKGIWIDIDEFRRQFEEHREMSRTATEGKFKGGLADYSEEITRMHTATHLLQAALRKVLGDGVHQMGSNITKERLRFDFSFSRKMTPEEIAEVEKLVNEVIQQDLPVERSFMSYDEAIGKGALAFFKETYGEEVSVYSVGDFSMELCGGPHVERTGVLRGFKITKQRKIGANVVRVRAIICNA
ncbi:MAG: alanine--tRNA ligase [Candidatus Thorarchaeota archaeon]|nr:alanine--tRNA ligase [Candidatus Thorarchaeota archaeon]